MTTFNVGSGVTSSGITLSSGDFLLVSSGGIASATTVSGGGTEIVFVGGSASFSIVSSGGSEVVGGGTVSDTMLVGGNQVINSGGIAINTIVDSGGAEFVSGGIASGTTVFAGGVEFVSSGGIASATVVSGGAELVFNGGVATATTVLAAGFEIVSSGGIASATVLNGGAEIISGGGQAINAVVNSGGNLSLSAGGTDTGTIVNSGGQEFVFSGGTASGTLVNSGGELFISGGGLTLLDLQQGGVVDLQLLPFNSSATINLDQSTTIVSIVENGATVVTAQLAGDYTGEFFHLSDDLGGGTLITVDGTPCYCLGTHILTPLGEIEVENLCIGDHVLNHKGEARPIRWIGRRSYAGRFAAANREVMPILIRAGALADGVPRRDLMVSPNHAMYIDDVLIPADGLVNGSSIVRVAEIDRVEYFHIELESHDVILAEGALSETFVDDDSRGMFHNAAEFGMLYPGASRSRPVYCAPRVEDGELLEAVRQRLAARALNAEPKTADAVPVLGKLVGNLDTAGRERISGWARDRASPNAPVRLRIYDNDVVIGEVVADLFRPDLKEAGVGNGRHGFELEFPGGLSPLVRHVIH
jgi:O-antigen biosynthesis protein